MVEWAARTILLSKAWWHIVIASIDLLWLLEDYYTNLNHKQFHLIIITQFENCPKSYSPRKNKWGKGIHIKLIW